MVEKLKERLKKEKKLQVNSYNQRRAKLIWTIHRTLKSIKDTNLAIKHYDK